MRKKFLPPDLELHQIRHRLDGFVIDQDGRIPRSIADLIIDAMLSTRRPNEVDRIRRRMQLRQYELEFASRVMKACELRFRLARKA